MAETISYRRTLALMRYGTLIRNTGRYKVSFTMLLKEHHLLVLGDHCLFVLYALIDRAVMRLVTGCRNFCVMRKTHNATRVE